MFLNSYLLLSLIIFMSCVFNLLFQKKTMILNLMSMELILMSVNVMLMIFSLYLDDILGQIFVIFILTLVAVETSLGFSIVIMNYNMRGNIVIYNFNDLYC